MEVHKLRLCSYIYFYYAANHSRVPVSVVACMRCHAYTGMFPVGDTSSVCVCMCCRMCVCQSVSQSVSQSFCPPTYRYIAPRMIQRIILKLCGYVGCDDATNVSNFGYEPIKFSSLKLIK